MPCLSGDVSDTDCGGPYAERVIGVRCVEVVRQVRQRLATLQRGREAVHQTSATLNRGRDARAPNERYVAPRS